MQRWILVARRHDTNAACHEAVRAAAAAYHAFIARCRVDSRVAQVSSRAQFAVIFDVGEDGPPMKWGLSSCAHYIVEPLIEHEPASVRKETGQSVQSPLLQGKSAKGRVMFEGRPVSDARVTPVYGRQCRRVTIPTVMTDSEGFVFLPTRSRKMPTGAIVAPASGYWSKWVDAFDRNERHIDVDLRELPPGPHGWWHALMDADGNEDPRDGVISIGVIDTGCGPHAALSHVVNHGTFAFGVHTGDGSDLTGHGTHLCGLLGARPTVSSRSGYIGIIPGVQLHSVRVVPPGESAANQLDISMALRRLMETGVDIAVIGVAAEQPSEILREAITDAARNGVLCVCAAGNTGGSVCYPAAFDHTVAVGAIGLSGWAQSDAMTQLYRPSPSERSRFGILHGEEVFVPVFSCTGPAAVTCVAPGVGLISCAPSSDGERYAEMSGTSMAAALAAGALASRLARSSFDLGMPRTLDRTDRSRSSFDLICHAVGIDPLMGGRGLPLLTAELTTSARSQLLGVLHDAASFSPRSVSEVPHFRAWPRFSGNLAQTQLVPRTALDQVDSGADEALDTRQMPSPSKKGDMTLRNLKGRKPVSIAGKARFAAKYPDLLDTSAMSRVEYPQRPGARRTDRVSAASDLECHAPWAVVRLSRPRESNSRDVWIAAAAVLWPCPLCGRQVPVSDRTATKVFRGVVRARETFVHVRIPVVECPHHGRHQIRDPWTRNERKWTYLRDEGIDDAGRLDRK